MVAAAALTLSACQGAAEPEPTATADAGETGVVSVLLAAQPAILDPVVAGRNGQIVWATMIEPLITLDPELNLTGDGIVTAWERTDPTTWEFTVRPGVEFTNGELADAAAVAENILLARDADRSVLKSYFGNVESAEAVDDQTVIVTTGTPQYNLATLLTTLYLVPPAYYAEVGSEAFALDPIGTGPYVWEGMRAGQSMSVIKNPDYWGDAPLNEGIEFTWANEAAQRLALLQSGGVDIALDLPPVQAEQARTAGMNVTSVSTAMQMVAFLDTTKPPFDDPQLREAVALAIDRDAIVAGIFDGAADADGGFLNVIPGQEPSVTVDADPERAAELVSGSPQVTVYYPTAQYTNIKEVAEAVGGSLEAAGFSVTYDPMDYGTLIGRVNAREVPGLFLFAGIPNAPTPDFFASGFMKSDALTGNCPSAEVDAMVASALEQDSDEAAAAIYDELNTLTVVDMNCYVPLYRQVFNLATLPTVDGVLYGALNTLDLTSVTKEP